MNPETILNCPFCGAKAKPLGLKVFRERYSCSDDKCPGSSISEPFDIWNRRPPADWSAAAREIPEASSNCPICGKDTPHGHFPEDIEKWLHAQASRFGHDFDLVRYQPSTVNLAEFVKHWREQPYWGWSGVLLHRALDELDALIKRHVQSQPSAPEEKS